MAIWQAMYFYTQGKATEGRVETALAGMKAQVETLQAVNAKITERLARFATSQGMIPLKPQSFSPLLCAASRKSRSNFSRQVKTPTMPI
ncbi:MAG: hypothetical protein MZV65_03560 [Chromatiales bacterium]|nr:hypothetical protein [Chromatiales bacterium]